MGETIATFFALYAEASARQGFRADPEWADRQFPLLVARGPLRLWRPDMPIAEQGIRLLLGVATWSGYDMRLLDLIIDSKRRIPREESIVDLFNVADCRRPGDVRNYVPKLRQVFHTPVFGVWRNGRFQEARQGHQARNLVALRFGSSSDEITQYVQDWIKVRSPLPS